MPLFILLLYNIIFIFITTQFFLYLNQALFATLIFIIVIFYLVEQVKKIVKKIVDEKLYVLNNLHSGLYGKKLIYLLMLNYNTYKFELVCRELLNSLLYFSELSLISASLHGGGYDEAEKRSVRQQGNSIVMKNLKVSNFFRIDGSKWNFNKFSNLDNYFDYFTVIVFYLWVRLLRR